MSLGFSSRKCQGPSCLWEPSWFVSYENGPKDSQVIKQDTEKIRQAKNFAFLKLLISSLFHSTEEQAWVVLHPKEQSRPWSTRAQSPTRALAWHRTWTSIAWVELDIMIQILIMWQYTVWTELLSSGPSSQNSGTNLYSHLLAHLGGTALCWCCCGYLK